MEYAHLIEGEEVNNHLYTKYYIMEYAHLIEGEEVNVQNNLGKIIQNIFFACFIIPLFLTFTSFFRTSQPLFGCFM